MVKKAKENHQEKKLREAGISCENSTSPDKTSNTSCNIP